MKTLQECIDTINEFAHRYELTFVEDAGIGHDRECVGLLDKRGGYISYNPIDSEDGKFDYFPEYYCEEFEYIKPDDAYHKYNCIAVLGRGEEAIRQLCQWVESLDEIGIEIVKYQTDGSSILDVYSESRDGYTLRKL